MKYITHGKGWIGDTRICTNDYYQDDDGRMWLNGAETAEEHQRQGYGREMVKAAVDCYGNVFVSKASPMEHKEYGDDADARHLSKEGAALVESCIRHGILKPEWLQNPFNGED